MSAFLSGALTVPAAYTLLTPDVSLPFDPDQTIFRATAGNYFYSFDGVNDHGMVNTGEAALIILSKRRKVWLKQNGGAATARIAAHTIV